MPRDPRRIIPCLLITPAHQLLYRCTHLHRDFNWAEIWLSKPPSRVTVVVSQHDSLFLQSVNGNSHLADFLCTSSPWISCCFDKVLARKHCVEMRTAIVCPELDSTTYLLSTAFPLIRGSLLRLAPNFPFALVVLGLWNSNS